MCMLWWGWVGAWVGAWVRALSTHAYAYMTQINKCVYVYVSMCVCACHIYTCLRG